MSTLVRSEISKRNENWISKNRYYELRHFCLQYKEWKNEYKNLEWSIQATRSNIKKNGCNHSVGDPTYSMALRLERLSGYVKLVSDTAFEADPEIADYLIKAVTEDRTYEYLKTIMDIPCGKSYYYKAYRKFFYLLSRER